MRARKGGIIVAGAAALALFACVFPHNRADIRILAHDRSDLSPHRLRAAVDVGVVAVSLLITWTTKTAR